MPDLSISEFAGVTDITTPCDLAYCFRVTSGVKWERCPAGQKNKADCAFRNTSLSSDSCSLSNPDLISEETQIVVCSQARRGIAIHQVRELRCW